MLSLIHTTSYRFKAYDIIYGPINEIITRIFLKFISGNEDDIAFSTPAFFFIKCTSRNVFCANSLGLLALSFSFIIFVTQFAVLFERESF
jgi:hypothetical protein